MTIKKLIKEMEINESDIVYILGEKDINKNIHNGCEIKITDCCTGEKQQIITIHPNIEWTDGTYKPKYITGYVSLFLSKRYDENEIFKKTYSSRRGVKTFKSSYKEEFQGAV